MQYCTSCQKAIATVHILDLQDGTIAHQKHLCSSCAEQAGMVQPKAQPLKLNSSEMLDLISSLKLEEGELERRGTSCPSCGLSLAEFRVRGRMGCPRCYEVFRSSLLPVLERVHDATTHCGRAPAGGPKVTPPAPLDLLVQLKQRLEKAIGAENYEEAASLRDQIRDAEAGHGDPR